jgi:hypothetical protein
MHFRVNKMFGITLSKDRCDMMVQKGAKRFKKVQKVEIL